MVPMVGEDTRSFSKVLTEDNRDDACRMHLFPDHGRMPQVGASARCLREGERHGLRGSPVSRPA